MDASVLAFKSIKCTSWYWTWSMKIKTYYKWILRSHIISEVLALVFETHGQWHLPFQVAAIRLTSGQTLCPWVSCPRCLVDLQINFGFCSIWTQMFPFPFKMWHPIPIAIMCFRQIEMWTLPDITFCIIGPRKGPALDYFNIGSAYVAWHQISSNFNPCVLSSTERKIFALSVGGFLRKLNLFCN